MVCGNCGVEISEARRLALPEETWCVDCVTQDGDVERIQGVMLWHHKTAPELYTGPGVKTIRSYARRGMHASLPFNSYENPRLQASRRAQTELQEVKAVLLEIPPPELKFVEVSGGPSMPMATCHGDRPRVSPDGKCLECALVWYQQRRPA